MALYGIVRKAGRAYRSYACAANRTGGLSVCDNARSMTEGKVIQAIAETIRVTAADFLPDFVTAFEVESSRERQLVRHYGRRSRMAPKSPTAQTSLAPLPQTPKR